MQKTPVAGTARPNLHQVFSINVTNVVLKESVVYKTNFTTSNFRPIILRRKFG